GKSGFAVSLKRYRFSNKERDDETGLYYFGARYYATWLGRWTSTDPLGFVKGFNLFRYCANNPVIFADPTGTQEISYRNRDVNLTGVTDPAEAGRRLRSQGFDFTGFDTKGKEMAPVEGHGAGLPKRVGGNWKVGHWLALPGQGESGGNGQGGDVANDQGAG